MRTDTFTVYNCMNKCVDPQVAVIVTTQPDLRLGLGHQHSQLGWRML